MSKWRATAVALASSMAVQGPLAEGLQDPTRPLLFVAEPAAEAPGPVEKAWRLSMVRVSASVRSAVLNGAVVHEGDMVGGARIARIVPGSVVIEEGGRHTVVALAGEPLKRPAGPDALTRTGK